MSIKPEERIYDAAKKQHYFVWAISDHVSNVEPIFNRTMDYVSELETENAELRELIADVHEALCADKAGMFYKLILANMEDDMRELGVEMDR